MASLNVLLLHMDHTYWTLYALYMQNYDMYQGNFLFFFFSIEVWFFWLVFYFHYFMFFCYMKVERINFWIPTPRASKSWTFAWDHTMRLHNKVIKSSFSYIPQMGKLLFFNFI